MNQKTLEPPTAIDDARVLYLGCFEDEKSLPSHFSKKPVQALAICTYDNQSYYLFVCDKDWKVLNDSQHATMDLAMTHAHRTFKNEKISWKRM